MRRRRRKQHAERGAASYVVANIAYRSVGGSLRTPRFGLEHCLAVQIAFDSRQRRGRKKLHGAAHQHASDAPRSSDIRSTGSYTKCARRFCCPARFRALGAERLLFAVADVRIRLAEMPSEISACLVALARLSPSARLYSVEPRSSQCPSMVKSYWDAAAGTRVSLQHTLILLRNVGVS